MKQIQKISMLLVFLLCSFTIFAQTKIKGKVTDGSEPVIGANVTIKGTTEGTITDVDGNFEISTTQATPLTLVVTMVGMASSEIKIEGNKDDVSVTLAEESSMLTDVVVAASRVEEKILESPVTIEKMDAKAIKGASSADYYDDLSKLKGVQTINGSMTLTSVNARGFGGISNTRFVQLMDGMDNAAPLLNFPTGNVVGIGELDINNVELVPGAASALYGPNAFNGILLMNSKNPFEQPGFSMQVKGGFAQAGNGYGIKGNGSVGLRMAHAFKSKKTGEDFLAVKANFSVFSGTDWLANDYLTDRITEGNPTNSPNFDGLNTYGDENRIFVAYEKVKPLFYNNAYPSVRGNYNAGYEAQIRAGVTAQVKAQVKAGIIFGNPGIDDAVADAQAAIAILSPPYSTDIDNNTATILALKQPEIDTVASIFINVRLDSVKSLLGFDLRRTGLTEDKLIDNHKAQSIKGDFGVYLRPFKDKSYEFSYNYRIGYGNSVYQGSERYALRNFTQQFHKVEIKGKDFFIRSYMSQTKDGDSYNMTALGAFTNESVGGLVDGAFKTGSKDYWAPTYIRSYGTSIVNLALTSPSAAAALATATPQFIQTLNDSARARADRPWTSLSPEQQQAQIEAVRNGLFQRGGAGFIDNSRLFHTEAMLDLSRWTGKWIDIQIGGNHRLYSLQTEGTVFNQDPDGTGVYKRIKIKEYGAFIQLQRKLFKDHLKIQASVRVDKNQNFKAIVSPRVAVVGTFGKNREHNIRASYQTGFRNPDSQAQYIYFPASKIILGGTKENAERYGIYNGGAYTQDSYDKYVAASIIGDTAAAGNLEIANFDYVKPENLQVIELGYKGVFFKKLLIDINGYFNIYKDFIIQKSVVNIDTTFHKGLPIVPGTSWSIYTNSPEKIYSYGVGIGAGYALPKGLMVRASYNYMDYKIAKSKANSVTKTDLGFNSAKHQVFVGILGTNVWKGLGFGIDYRWQSSIVWTSDFANGTVKARGMLDANISYFVEKAMTTFKVGATNMAGPDYRTNVGGPFIGRTFYAAITFDQNKMWKDHHREVTGKKEF